MTTTDLPPYIGLTPDQGLQDIGPSATTTADFAAIAGPAQGAAPIWRAEACRGPRAAPCGCFPPGRSPAI
jgi:hypothetical protein